MTFSIAFGAATFLTILLAFHAYIAHTFAPESSEWGKQLARTITGWYLWAAFFPIILRLANRWRFATNQKAKSILIHFCAGAILAITHAVLQILLADWLLEPNRSGVEIGSLIKTQLISGLFWRFFIYQALLTFAIAFHSHQRARKVELQATRMENKILQTRIESLKSRLDPEFLFQSLKELSRLMRNNFDQAESLVARLGRYLRMRLDNSPGPDTTLGKEMEFLKCFIDIENLKRGTSSTFHLDIDKDVFDCVLPGGVLQSWLEDALGSTDYREDNKHFRIHASSSDGHLKLLLEISGVTKTNYAGLQQHVQRLNEFNRRRILLSFASNQVTQIAIPVGTEIGKPEEPSADSPVQQINLFRSETVVRKWLIITGVFTALALYFTIQRIMISASRGTSINWPQHLLDYSGWYIWALLTPLVLRIAAKYPLQKQKAVQCATVHFLGFFSTWVFATLAMETVKWGANLGDYNLSVMLPLSFARSPISLDVLCYSTIIAVESALRFKHRFESGKIRTEKLSGQLNRAKLEVLKTQIHPHFLFNSLNSLSELMQEDPAGAEKMIRNLEMFLRMTINENDIQEIPFEKEIQFLQSYLAIEKVRYQDRLNIRMAIEPEAMSVSVPCLLLQPIVENAIRHGIAARSTADGQIEIHANRKNGTLALSIRDNGPGIHTTNKNQLRSGLGLSNTRERLKQLYGKKHRFEFINAPEGGLLVNVEIPAISG